jgi:hypothetical protein
MSGRVRVIVAIAALPLVVLAVAYFLGRPEPTDEEKLYGVIKQAQRAVEVRHSSGLTRLLSRDYMDPYGTSRQQLVAMIVQWMRSGDDLEVMPQVTGLEVRDDFADMALRVQIWRGREPSGAVEEYAMKLRLRREGRHWKVLSAEGLTEAQSDLMNSE